MGNPIKLSSRSARVSRAFPGLYLGLLGFLSLAFLLATLQEGIEAKDDAETRLRYIREALVQDMRARLKNDEVVLRALGNELVAVGALQTPARGRPLLERMASTLPGLVGLAMARPDGHFILTDEDQTIAPTLLLRPEIRKDFDRSLASGHLQIGRAVYVQSQARWIIPLYVPLVDPLGHRLAVITAGYPVGTNTFWRAMAPPADTQVAVLRDDNFLLYFHPLPPGPGRDALRTVYGQPVHSETVHQLAAVRHGSGLMTIDLPRDGGWHLLAYEYLDDYGLLAGSFTPWRAILLDWLYRLSMPGLLLGVFLVSGAWIYRRARSRQAASEAAVAHLSAWQQAVLDGAEYSIISTDTSGTIVSFNAAAQRMLGYSAEEMIGHATPALIHDEIEIRERAVELSQKLGEPIGAGFEVFVAMARRGQPEEREWTYLRKDGSRFPVRLSVTRLLGPNGEIEGFIGIAADLSEHQKARADLRDSEARYRILFERAGDSIFLMQGEQFVDCNPATLEMFGCNREQIIGATPYRYSPEYQSDGRSSRIVAQERITAALQGETQFFEWRHQRHDGSIFDAEVTLNVVVLGKRPHIVANVRDISLRKKAEAELVHSRQALIERNENLRLINQLANRLHASLAVDDILKEAMDALLGLTHAPHIAVYLLESEAQHLNLVASRGFNEELLRLGAHLPLEGSLSGLAIAGKQLLVSNDFAHDVRLQPELRSCLTAASLRSGAAVPMMYHERPLGCINLIYADHRVFNDVELETFSAFSNTVALAIVNARHTVSLALQARHDSLTGLPNRSVLHEEFAQRTAGGRRGSTALLLLDLDRFKEINDTLGHHVGDRLLTHIGPRLAETCNGHDALICRLGGDEFALLLHDLSGHDEAAALAARVIEALRQPFMVEDMALQLGASVGVAYYPEHGENSHALLRAADVAMYRAKKLTTGVVVYDRAFDDYSPERLALASELVQALQRNELVLHYQPKLDIAHGTITGFEALVRWQNPRLGMLYPDSFLHLVEMNEVIHPFTRAVMDMALADKRRLHDLGYTQPVAINLSVRNLIDARCVARLGEAVAQHGVPSQEVELELTETALMYDPDSAVALLQEIAATGVNIAIDDFGTGYSSLSYLRRLPLKSLKIDRSFVMGMNDNAQDAIIVRSTVALAHSLGLGVIAEGVENAETLALLEEMGCDQAQGYHFSRPLPLKELIAWLGRARSASAWSPTSHRTDL